MPVCAGHATERPYRGFHHAPAPTTTPPRRCRGVRGGRRRARHRRGRLRLRPRPRPVRAGPGPDGHHAVPARRRLRLPARRGRVRGQQGHPPRPGPARPRPAARRGRRRRRQRPRRPGVHHAELRHRRQPARRQAEVRRSAHRRPARLRGAAQPGRRRLVRDRQPDAVPAAGVRAARRGHLHRPGRLARVRGGGPARRRLAGRRRRRQRHPEGRPVRPDQGRLGAPAPGHHHHRGGGGRARPARLRRRRRLPLRGRADRRRDRPGRPADRQPAARRAGGPQPRRPRQRGVGVPADRGGPDGGHRVPRRHQRGARRPRPDLRVRAVRRSHLGDRPRPGPAVRAAGQPARPGLVPRHALRRHAGPERRRGHPDRHRLDRRHPLVAAARRPTAGRRAAAPRARPRPR